MRAAARNTGKPLGPHPRSAVPHRLGVRLLSFDRPGYGGSDRLAARRVAHAAADVLAIADTYGLDRFSVPVLLWHGDSDVFSPASQARWLADRIPSAAVVVQAGAAHFGALDVLRASSGGGYPMPLGTRKITRGSVLLVTMRGVG